MGKRTLMVCDVCGKEIEPFLRFIKLKPKYIKREADNDVLCNCDEEVYICRNCLREIGRRVADRTDVEINVEMNKRGDK